jgi:predicted PurR-regulated permease PerM
MGFRRFPPWLWPSLILPLGLLNIWVLLQVLEYFQSPIRIFIIANLLAFILGYPVRWLQRHPHIQRLQAVILVLIGAGLILACIAVLVVPPLMEQVRQLLHLLAKLGDVNGEYFQLLDRWTIQWQLPSNLKQFALRASEQIPGQIQGMLGHLLGLLIWTAGGLFEAGFILIITVYLLLRGREFWDGIFRWFPRRWRHPVRQSLRRSFQNYYIGQATVAGLLGVSLSLALIVFQIPFGLLSGLAVGVMALFPFGGAITIALVSALATFHGLWVGVQVLVIATIIDQIVENGLAPRLLGKFTGVHPVWVLLSLMIGAKVAGILGILIAVPCTSFIKEMIDEFFPSPLP